MRVSAKRMIFLGSDHVVMMVDNSLRMICARRALRRLACEGRRSGSSQVLTAFEKCGAGDWLRRPNFAAHRCADRVNREDRGFSPYLPQIHREVQECTLTWSFGPKSAAVC